MSLPIIAVTNASTCLSDVQVRAVLPALQKQVETEFNAYWQENCTLTFLSKDHALTRGWWQVIVLDNPDQAGALGYHELSHAGTPLGKVFAEYDLRNGLSWTVTLSHELLEMLADPWINWCAIGSDRRVYALEVCDPVEADELAYTIDGVLVSNFVTRHGLSQQPAQTAGTTGGTSRANWKSMPAAMHQSSIRGAVGSRSRQKAKVVQA